LQTETEYLFEIPPESNYETTVEYSSYMIEIIPKNPFNGYISACKMFCFFHNFKNFINKIIHPDDIILQSTDLPIIGTKHNLKNQFKMNFDEQK
jgi:hypothetical protein